MKQIIFFSSLFVFSLLVSCGETKEETKEATKEAKQSIESIKIQEIGLEVMTKDLGVMNWEDAKKACADLGAGWQLPTKDELEEIYKYKDKIGGFADDVYWSSTEFNYGYAWLQNFNNGLQYYYYKNTNYYVRAVRALK